MSGLTLIISYKYVCATGPPAPFSSRAPPESYLQRHALSDLSPAVRHRNAVSEGRSIFYGGSSHFVL